MVSGRRAQGGLMHPSFTVGEVGTDAGPVCQGKC